MRSFTAWARVLYSVFSLQFILRIADTYGQWEWFERMLIEHPTLAAIARGPFFPLICLALMVVLVEGRKYFEQARLRSRLTNSKVIGDLTKITMKAMFDADSQSKPPGWDKIELDWVWFVEIQTANESATPVTVDEVQVSVRCRSEKWKWLPLRVKKLPATPRRIFTDCRMDNNEGLSLDNKEVPNILDTISGTPMSQGVGYRGWLAFHVKANQRDMNNGEGIKVWLVDALRHKHRVRHKRNSEKKWDQTLTISFDSRYSSPK